MANTEINKFEFSQPNPLKRDFVTINLMFCTDKKLFSLIITESMERINWIPFVIKDYASVSTGCVSHKRERERENT